MRLLSTSVLLCLLAGSGLSASPKKPNIILFITDDQDAHLGSVPSMPSVQKHLVQEGTSYENHWVTDAQCCPSRATLIRGQQAHNTNITHVRVPGGNYDKWLASEQDLEYLPHWLNAAGYSTNYIGKLLNGLSLTNYSPAPRGWTDIDALLEPYIYDFNRAVLSKNGDRPLAYPGWHQSDILRIKVLERLRELNEDGDPFLYIIAPTAPHNIPGRGNPVPCARHNDTFSDIVMPKRGNWNPSDTLQANKVAWVRDYPPLTDTQISQAELLHKRRLQSLQGVDEIVDDVVAFLDDNELLDNTYIIFTTDNGYSIGSHRIPAIKALAYREAGQIPFIVRGPGVPRNATSDVPSTHTDLAPTFLEIAGVAASKFPPLFDGRSLLRQWHGPHRTPGHGEEDTSQDSKEIIQVEFWGEADIELPNHKSNEVSTFKALRIVSPKLSFLYTRWCTNELELYNTNEDPYELINLAIDPTEENQRVISRLNALLLILKSCEAQSCRNPWIHLSSNFTDSLPPSKAPAIDSLKRALKPQYDDYFAEFPNVAFGECSLIHDISNELPFYPENATEGLGSRWRTPVENWVTLNPNFASKVPINPVNAGSVSQRSSSFSELMADARDLTDAELGLE